jgi:uncharacterized protein (TIGR02099 family)
MRPPVKTLLRVLEVLAWAGFFAFAAMFLTLRYWLLPNVERYREDIVAGISRSIGLPVKIGALATDWQGLRPRLSIADVRVYDRDGREALALPTVENVVSWRSLLAFDLRLHSFVIDSPKLAVRRDAQGDIFVAGIRVTEGKGDGKVADWILRQNQIVIRGAEIEWRDESRGAPPLVLSALNLRLQNDGDEHSIGLTARPPRQLGPGIELRATLEGRSLRQPAKWSGRVYAEFGYTDLSGWRAWVDYPLDVRRGEGALRLWATLAGGKLTQATADVALQKVIARLGKNLPVLEIAEVRGRVFARETEHGYDFGVRNLALSAPGAPPMSATSFRATWQPAAANQPQRGAVTANLIELGPLVHVSEFLPFPEDLRKLLVELAPRGNLLDARFEWSGRLPDEATYTGKTRFTGLSMNAWRMIPGFAGLSGSVEANERRGSLQLASRKSELELPRVFPEPRLHLDALSGEVAWERPTARDLAVRLANLSFANEDLAGTANGSYAWTGEGPGVVDLSAQLSRADGRNTARYLPHATIMGAATRDWVARAVLAGQSNEARLRLKGDLRDFPFVDPAKGQFQVVAKVGGAVLDYVSGWPRIEGIEGELMFERDRIEIVGRSGSILGAKLANVRVSVPGLGTESPRVAIDGQAEGPTVEFLDFIRQSPVRRMVSGVTDGMTSVGRGKLRLRLELPLADLAHSKVAGDYQFSGNRVTVDPRLPPIERASGRVGFTESALTVHDVRGRLFDGDVAVAGGTRPDGEVVVTARGRATVEGLRGVFDHPWRRRLAGASSYVATVSVREGRSHLSFESGLEGVSSSLPQPMAKNAADALPLRVEVFPGENRDRVSVLLGAPASRLVAAEFLRVGQGAAMQVQRSLVVLNPVAGEALRVPERRGTTLRGNLPALDLDRWLPLLGESNGSGAAGVTAGEAVGATADGGSSFDLKVGVLDALGKRMRGVSMQGITDGGGWSATMNTTEFAGDLVYRTEGSGRLVARFSRFVLPEDAPGTKSGEAAKELPAVDIVAESFTHRNRKLGRVEIQARHEGRDWRIDKLAMLNPDSALTGTGLWKVGDKSRTSINFKLDVSDVGQFLERFGYPDHIKGGNAALGGTLTWTGDPTTMDYATLGGDLQLQSHDGQFLEIDPGIGKLVSLMSLQMLPRRMALDFRDVFSKGFQYDRIASNLGIERGVMNVKEFRMRGPAADVTMTGQVDLSLETQSLAVKVIPQFGDSASTVVGLLNPVAGVAALIAGRLMKNPLGQIFAYDYAISGTWTDPKVEKVSAPRSVSGVPATTEGAVPPAN